MNPGVHYLPENGKILLFCLSSVSFFFFSAYIISLPDEELEPIATGRQQHFFNQLLRPLYHYPE